MRKFACAIIQEDKEFEELFKDGEEKGMERGLELSFKTKNISGDLHDMFEVMAQRGYYVSGFICKENNKLEFLFYRDENQKTNDKLTEKPIVEKYIM